MRWSDVLTCAAATAGVVMSGVAGAQPIEVNPGGSIQQAINAAPEGATIVVHPGTYIGPIQFANSANGTPKSLTIRSSDGAAVTTIDASTFGLSAVRCIDVPGVDAVLEGFTITGGASPTHGGGVYVEGTTLAVRDCVITGNTSVNHGAGLALNLATVTVDGCDINGNNASGVGGGLYGLSSTGSLTVTNSRLEGNSGTTGGALYSNLPVTVTSVVFEGNEARTSNGGALVMVGRPLRATGCLFQENVAEALGGAIYLSATADIIIESCGFHGNQSGTRGGAIAVGLSGSSTLSPLLRNCAFAGNVAENGGGLMVGGPGANSWTQVVNCTFAGNDGGNTAGAVVVASGSTLVMTNSSAHGNGTEELRVDGAATIRHCNVDTSNPNGAGTISAASEANFLAAPVFEREPSDGGDGWADDPMTTEANEAANNDYGDLRLTAGSPDIDRGDTPFYTALDGPLTDLGGAGRGVNDAAVPDADGVPVIGPIVIDVGAYEFQAGPMAACPCELDGDAEQVNVFDLLAYLDCWFSASGGAPCP